MKFTNASDNELHILLSALGDYSKTQEKCADDIAAMRDGMPEDMRDIPERMRETAREADEMRAWVANEMHRRGKTACSLAHPNIEKCPFGVDVPNSAGH